MENTSAYIASREDRIKVRRRKHIEEIAEIDDIRLSSIDFQRLDESPGAHQGPNVIICGHEIVDGERRGIVHDDLHVAQAKIHELPKEIREPLLKWAKDTLIREVSA